MMKAFYATCWEPMLRGLLKWPDDKIIAWIQKRLNDWARGSLIETEDPDHYIASEILRSSFEHPLGPRICNLTMDMQRIISNHRERDVRKYSPSQWEEIRNQLHEFLQNYGGYSPTWFNAENR